MYKKIAILLLLLLFTANPAGVAAAEKYSKHYLIDDFEMTDWLSMSVTDVQRFLETYGSHLATYRTKDIDGLVKSAAEIIWQAGQNYGISQKFLLVLLQREQSLVEDKTPTQKQIDWAMGYGVCDSCKITQPGIQKFRGFARQIDQAAWRQRYYLAHPEEFRVQVGQPIVIDGQAVVPHNQATANLYIYTPHLRGNLNFATLWQKYFTRAYPDGSLLESELTGDVWLIQDNVRRRFASLSALYADYDMKRIIRVPHDHLDSYPVGVPVKFVSFSLLRSPENLVYLLVDGQKRVIPDQETMRQLGYNPEEVIDATWEEIIAIPEGQPLSTQKVNPLGELWQHRLSGGVYFVRENSKQPIIDRAILKTRFARLPLIQVSDEELLSLNTKEPIGFKSGELVKTSDSPVVYLIDGKQKRAFGDEATFLSYGYQFSNVITTTAAALRLHETGVPLAL